ncbi:MAG TPA: hypothetical protein VFP05_02555 [Thermomicrobiales bacterium]|nr:hypothetical protein [Thermomicrobiales bacterium]
MNRHRPPRCSQKTNYLGLFVLASMLLVGPRGAAAQPNPGIDPCSRALAQLATPAVAGTPDPDANRLAVSQAIMNFASCFNRHNWDGVLALSDDAFRQSFIGSSTDDATRRRLDLLASRGLLPELRIQSIEDNGATGSKLAAMAVTWQAWHGLHRELWRLQSVDGNWILSGRDLDRPLVSGVAAGIELTVDEDHVTAPRSDLVNPGTIILAFDNQQTAQVTVLVLSVEPSASTSSVVGACNDPDTPLDPAASVSIDPGSIVYLPLIELPPGRYAILTGADPCIGSEPMTHDEIALLDVTE